MQMQNKIANEMKKVERKIQEDKLSDYQKIKRQLREQKVSAEDVEAKMLEIQSKKFSSNFKSFSRDHWKFMYRNRTNQPPIGHYRPKIEVVKEKSRLPIFFPHHSTSEKAFKKKFDVAKSSVSLCPHVLRHINPQKQQNFVDPKTNSEIPEETITPLDIAEMPSPNPAEARRSSVVTKDLNKL